MRKYIIKFELKQKATKKLKIYLRKHPSKLNRY